MEAGDERRFRRRRFVVGAASGAAALALPAWLRPTGGSSLRDRARGARRAVHPQAPDPARADRFNLTIPIEPAEVKILPGRKTKMWTYDGTFPGPTIRRPSGERTTVTFKHRLPKKAGDLTVHLHGAHTRSKDDGQPGASPLAAALVLLRHLAELSERESGNDVLIKPG